ncbi:MAG TPA: hypothetical protein VFK52_03110 [Nocardioidaceae bacterium]|nr:hypothetical protein [Nocardioidaceae bacterium]
MTRENLKLIAVATFCLTVGLAGPSVAGALQKGLNADQVDGKHAVGAKTPIAKRKNKLVATNKQGFLPSSIIKSARNAQRLGGYPHSALRVISIPNLTPVGAAQDALLGVSLPDGSNSYARFGVILPPDYRADSPLTLEYFYGRDNADPCTAVLDAHAVRYRTGLTAASTPTVDPGFGPVTLGRQGRLEFRILPDAGELKPGDALWVRFSRSGVQEDDVCPQWVALISAQLRY